MANCPLCNERAIETMVGNKWRWFLCTRQQFIFKQKIGDSNITLSHNGKKTWVRDPVHNVWVLLTQKKEKKQEDVGE